MPYPTSRLLDTVAGALTTLRGQGPAMRHRLLQMPDTAWQVREPVADDDVTTGPGPAWSAASRELQAYLDRPLMARTFVGYQRDLVDSYRPNETWLLPQAIAEELTELGRIPGQQPAGTYARHVLEQLLIDLSWSSSYLEGNSYSRVDTEQLFLRKDSGNDLDAIMLLNHRDAIEFMVDMVPKEGMTTDLLRNVHSMLMNVLLHDSESLGNIRHTVVCIGGSTFYPMQVPAVLEEMFEQIVVKANDVKNPMESAFFLWTQLAYLQAFVDGNKRLSRMAANVPLMLYNQAPLSFMDVRTEDYVKAMLGVYECGDMSIAADLFNWTYRRSLAKYKVIMEAMSTPDPFRMKYREALSLAMAQVVRQRLGAAHAVAFSRIPPEDVAAFDGLLQRELRSLTRYNCARFQLTQADALAWIGAGRPL